jgi:hypothetical protein
MIEAIPLSKFAVKVAGIHTPGNWDKPLGYDGSARYVAIYWDRSGDKVFITDGITGTAGVAWWLYTNLVDYEARPEIHAALMACGARPQSALGDPEHEATHALILDRFEHYLWVGPLNETARFLDQQHRRNQPDADLLRSALAGQKEALLSEAIVHFTVPCHCIQGWELVNGNYVPCPDCQGSDRIEMIP